jgi:hypothetical protein
LIIQKQLALPNAKPLSYYVQIDRAKNTDDLKTQIEYAEKHFYGDATYERENGKPLLGFFGVASTLSANEMAKVKSEMLPAAWIPNNTFWKGDELISSDWCDQVFQWSDNFMGKEDFKEGYNPEDPYNLKTVDRFFQGAARFPQKHFIGGMCPSFNGTLTKREGWSLGKYLPSGDGLCLVERAKRINEIIPANVTRMQWITWNDYEEGSAAEVGIENYLSVVAEKIGTTLTWKIEGGRVYVKCCG